MSTVNIADIIPAHVPFLRRYARALTGSQTRGDAIAAETLEVILQDKSRFDTSLAPRVAVYKLFHSIWITTSQQSAFGDTPKENRAQHFLSQLTPGTREALLLSTVEEFNLDDVGEILGLPGNKIKDLVDLAYKEMTKITAGKVMIIEDEVVISADLQQIVSEMGHNVTGLARTESDAIQLARNTPPDLVLSDIKLADDSSGIDAVNHITTTLPNTPVVLITAYPELYLTGETREPAFLITKPYEIAQIRTAVSQALFFSSIETLQPAG